MSYESDKEYSDQFIPTIRQIVGPLLLVESPLEVDRKQATDLIVLTARDMMVAARVRRPGFTTAPMDYSRQFTIRSKRDNGVETELSKIVNGFGDWMFYGHAVAKGSVEIDPWHVIDLNHFRAHLILEGQRRGYKLKKGHTRNPSDGTWFAWWDIDSFKGDPPLLVASSRESKPSCGSLASVESHRQMSLFSNATS